MAQGETVERGQLEPRLLGAAYSASNEAMALA